MLFLDTLERLLPSPPKVEPNNVTVPSIAGNAPIFPTNLTATSPSFARDSIPIIIPSDKNAFPMARDNSVNRVFNALTFASKDCM